MRFARLAFLCVAIHGAAARADPAGDTAPPAAKKADAPILRLLDRVTDAGIRFATYSPDHSPPIERRVAVTGPDEAVSLLSTGRLELIERLVERLKMPGRAWAANVMLSALTHVDGRTVDTYATNRRGWYRIWGKAAHRRWKAWLDEHRDCLRWNDAEQFFACEGD